MTRIEKYKSYREEIAKSSRLGKSIKDSDEDVVKYTKAINKINYSILRSIKEEVLTFDTGVLNIDVENKQLPEEVMNYFKTLNKVAINNQQEQINYFFHNKINHSIVDENNQFDQKWIESNKDYAQLVYINTKMGNYFIDETDFVNSLTDKYNTMTQSSGINKVQKINEVKPKSKNDALRKAMIGITILLLLIGVALLILTIVKGVKG